MWRGVSDRFGGGGDGGYPIIPHQMMAIPQCFQPLHMHRIGTIIRVQEGNTRLSHSNSFRGRLVLSLVFATLSSSSHAGGGGLLFFFPLPPAVKGRVHFSHEGSGGKGWGTPGRSFFIGTARHAGATASLCHGRRRRRNHAASL